MTALLGSHVPCPAQWCVCWATVVGRDGGRVCVVCPLWHVAHLDADAVRVALRLPTGTEVAG